MDAGSESVLLAAGQQEHGVAYLRNCARAAIPAATTTALASAYAAKRKAAECGFM